MMELLEKLYNYEYFGYYLMISIITLIIIFLIVLFFGKKDQKEREIEATKKLQQINQDAFKEENELVKLEIEKKEQEKLEDTIILPSIEEIPTINNVEVNEEIPDPVLPTEIEEETNNIEIEPIKEIVDEVFEEPILNKIEEKPLVFGDTIKFEEEFTQEINEKIEEENEEVHEEIEVPTFNFDELVKDVEETKKEEPITRGPQIFSSVYVPEKKEEVKVITETPKYEEDEDFELPVLKSSETKKEEVKEEKIEIPVLNDYNLDDLSGEVYNINR